MLEQNEGHKRWPHSGDHLEAMLVEKLLRGKIENWQHRRGHLYAFL